MYGMFQHISSSVVNLPREGKTNLGADIMGYGSQSTALHDGNVYMLFGRLVKHATGAYHLFKEQQLKLCLGSSSIYAGSDTQPCPLLGKVGVFGYGKVAGPTHKDPAQASVV
jgi:hypothetical protein